MGRALLAYFFIVSATAAQAASTVVEATVMEVTPAGFMLRIGPDPVAVETTKSTRFWRNFQAGVKDDFPAQTIVMVRIKADSATPELREIADKPTWDWLAQLKKEPFSGVIVVNDPKNLTLKFADGRQFQFRHTTKTKVSMAGQIVPAADLKPGQVVYAKGRALPSLDIWLVTVSDKPIAPKPTSDKSAQKSPPPVKLATAGKIKGTIAAHLAPYSMVDIFFEGRTYHVTYNPQTKVTVDGEKSSVKAIEAGVRIEATYRRDTFGRIIATKIDLFSSE